MARESGVKHECTYAAHTVRDEKGLLLSLTCHSELVLFSLTEEALRFPSAVCQQQHRDVKVHRNSGALL